MERDRICVWNDGVRGREKENEIIALIFVSSLKDRRVNDAVFGG